MAEHDGDVQSEKNAATPEKQDVGGPYAWYVLVVLVLVYVLNFIDRNILSILAEEIKADLGIGDAQIGFLYGTAFAVFYAVFGIPLARLADIWTRRKLISIGLFFWSAMTALSGTARGFYSLGAYRIGVGVGESSASPAAFSMLCDYFPPRMRATAVGIYSSGVYIGAGIGIFLGGWILDGWAALYPDGNAPFGLKGWQAAFMAVGLPGLLVAVWVWTLREPIRGLADGFPRAASTESPVKVLGRELSTIIPPFTFRTLVRAGAGTRGLVLNAAFLGVFIILAAGLTRLFGNPAQWWALSIGLYCVATWLQNLVYQDYPAFAMIFKSRAMVFGMFGFGFIAFKTYGIGFWLPPMFIRMHEVSPGEVGLYIGLGSAIGGWIGVTMGGVISDWLKNKTPRARIYVGYMGAVLCIPPDLFVMTTSNTTAGYIVVPFAVALSSLWIGPAIALANELVLPRMRATASSFYILMMTFVGLALGPYTMGRFSEAFAAGGDAPAIALRNGMIAGMGALGLAVACLTISGMFVVKEEQGIAERAKAVGEPDDQKQ